MQMEYWYAAFTMTSRQVLGVFRAFCERAQQTFCWIAGTQLFALTMISKRVLGVFRACLERAQNSLVQFRFCLLPLNIGIE